MTLPTCELHGVRLLEQLPRNCPLACPKATDEILRRKEQAFVEIGKPESDPIWHYRIMAAETCERCLRVNGGHPVMRYLRKQFQKMS